MVRSRVLNGVTIDHLFGSLLHVLNWSLYSFSGIILQHLLLVTEDAHSIIERVCCGCHSTLMLILCVRTGTLPKDSLGKGLYMSVIAVETT